MFLFSTTVDPFVIKHCPEVYFTGNTPRGAGGGRDKEGDREEKGEEKEKEKEGGDDTGFATELFQPKGKEGPSCRLISLPVFAETGEAVLVDLSKPGFPTKRIRFALG